MKSPWFHPSINENKRINMVYLKGLNAANVCFFPFLHFFLLLYFCSLPFLLRQVHVFLEREAEADWWPWAPETQFPTGSRRQRKGGKPATCHSKKTCFTSTHECIPSCFPKREKEHISPLQPQISPQFYQRQIL